jgi:hypothetical protein
MFLMIGARLLCVGHFSSSGNASEGGLFVHVLASKLPTLPGSHGFFQPFITYFNKTSR